MPVPEVFRGRMRVPAIAAPMFLVSGPQLVIATCKAGVAAAFPTLNARKIEHLGAWLAEMNASLGPQDSPYGVNLILHPSNTRLKDDFALVVEHRVPFVVTSLGHPGDIARAVHGYGGLVFSDIIHAHHAKKAIEAGVDGVIAVASGAGGHAGTQSAFSLIREIREFWDGVLILGGAISDGASIRAAEILGADFAYMGTRFIATEESMAQPEYKQMLVDCAPRDIVYTDAVSGTNANFLLPSLERAGYTRDQLVQGAGKGKLKDLQDEAKAWRDMWSAGHGVAGIHDLPTVAELVDRLQSEYRAACALPPSAAVV
ncbi:MAG: nitronate monooxygenase [Candidatus Methylophosphatis roskildensis]